MNKIKQIDHLIRYWEAAEIKACRKANVLRIEKCISKVNAFKAARAIFKRPSNQVNAPDVKCYCATAESGDWPCKICMAEYYAKHR